MTGIIAALLFLPALCGAQARESVTSSLTAGIGSLYGTAEIMRAGAERWTEGKKGDSLGNNDLLRVGDSSRARVRFSNGTEIFVNATSQILINLHHNPTRRTLSQHITVFFGAAFFVVSSILPGRADDLKVHTPTAVIAVRGTSFLVATDTTAGQTRVGVLSGTVLVRNILDRQSLFLRAGNQTIVSLNREPAAPAPLLQEDIAALESWVDTGTTRQLMKKQNLQSRRDHEVITGKTGQPIVVVEFSNGSEYEGPWNIGKGIAGHLVSRINAGAAVSSARLETPQEAGLTQTSSGTASRLVITGVVEEFDIVQYARISASADRYEEYNTARTRIRIQLIDNQTGRQIFESTFTGEATAKNRPENSWKVLEKRVFSIDAEGVGNSILGSAVKQACMTAVEEIGRYVPLR